MKDKFINVGDLKNIEILIPETLEELRKFVKDEEDLIYLAKRGLDQVQRTCLLNKRKRGASREEVQRIASVYFYHRKTQAW